MLTDPNEIEIISKAKQKNIRNPMRARVPFDNIFVDFFEGISLTGNYIDMGPGHFDFGEHIRTHGGTCVGLDNDPAVIKLGVYKGFEAIETNIQSLAKKSMGRKFDGVFNKFTFNAFWSWADEEKHQRMVGIIDDLLAENGWAWVGPWNGVPKKANLDEFTIEKTLDLQHRYFNDLGFDRHELSVEQTKYYGVSGHVANHVIFTKNLKWRPAR